MMTSDQTMSQRWRNYRPSKALWFWSVAGAVVLTMNFAITVGGWTSRETAMTMARDAVRDARAVLVANICVEKFITDLNAKQKLAELKETATYRQRGFIKDGGWVDLAGMDYDAPGAAALCANQLTAMDTLPVRSIGLTPDTTDS